MSVFSTNQNRQFFVINNSVTTEAAFATAPAGTVFVKTSQYSGGILSVQVKGMGGVTAINFTNDNENRIDKAVVVGPKSYKLKAYKLELNPEINEGNPVASQDYVVRVNFTGFSQENTYVKDGAVRVTSAMASDASKFYNALAVSLIKSFNRLYSPVVKIANAVTGDNKKIAVAVKNINDVPTAVDATGAAVKFTDGIYFCETFDPSNWSRDTKPFIGVDFQIIPTTITVDGEESVWGKVTNVTSTYSQAVPNGYKMAELEWFCMGERADQYRTIGYPNNINTQYMVDPTAMYVALEIDCHYEGNSENSMKSPKHITYVYKNTDGIAGNAIASAISTFIQKNVPNIG